MGNDFENAAYIETQKKDRKKRSGFWLFGGRGALMALGLAAVVAVAAVTATLTDARTTSKIYTFGDVKISLSDQTGTHDPIAPGAMATRTSEVKNIGTLPAYIFLKVQMPKDSSEELFEAPAPGEGWFDISRNVGAAKGEYVFAYGVDSELKPLAANNTISQTSKTQYKSTSANSKHDDVSVVVTAYAVQTTEVGSASDVTSIWGLVSNVTPR